MSANQVQSFDKCITSLAFNKLEITILNHILVVSVFLVLIIIHFQDLSINPMLRNHEYIYIIQIIYRFEFQQS